MCVPRGLFEQHKLVFSFMLCADIMRQAEKIADTEWNFFLRGAAGVEKVYYDLQANRQHTSVVRAHGFSQGSWYSIYQKMIIRKWMRRTRCHVSTSCNFTLHYLIGSTALSRVANSYLKSGPFPPPAFTESWRYCDSHFLNLYIYSSYHSLSVEDAASSLVRGF